MKTNTRFLVRHFNDYSEIWSNTYKTVELGYFPVSEYGCCRYFGLFYKGKKPSLLEVMKRINKKVVVGDFIHYRTKENIGISPVELREEVKRALHS